MLICRRCFRIGQDNAEVIASRSAAGGVLDQDWVRTPLPCGPGGGRSSAPKSQSAHRVLLPAERQCALRGAFTAGLSGPRPFHPGSCESPETGFQLPRRLSASGRRSAQARACGSRRARRSVVSGREFLGEETRQRAPERVGDRALPLPPWQPCATRVWTTRTARTSCPRAGSREPPRTAGFTTPSKGPQGGRRAWDAPGGAAPGALTASRARAPALPRTAPARGRARGPREAAVRVKELPQGGPRGPEEGSAAFLALGPVGSPGGAQARPLLLRKRRCTKSWWLKSLIPSPEKKKKSEKTNKKADASGALGQGARSMYFK